MGAHRGWSSPVEKVGSCDNYSGLQVLILLTCLLSGLQLSTP